MDRRRLFLWCFFCAIFLFHHNVNGSELAAVIISDAHTARGNVSNNNFEEIIRNGESEVGRRRRLGGVSNLWSSFSWTVRNFDVYIPDLFLSQSRQISKRVRLAQRDVSRAVGLRALTYHHEDDADEMSQWEFLRSETLFGGDQSNARKRLLLEERHGLLRHNTNTHTNGPRFESPLFNIFNTQYLCRIKLGGSRDAENGGGQTMTVIPDTGSYDFWVASSECRALDAGGRQIYSCPPDVIAHFQNPAKFALPFQRSLYNSSLSQSFVSSGETRRITYGDGTRVAAIGMLEDVKLVGAYIAEDSTSSSWFKSNNSQGADLWTSSLRVSEQRLSRVIDFSSPRKTILADGILGLAPPPFSSRMVFPTLNQHGEVISGGQSDRNQRSPFSIHKGEGSNFAHNLLYAYPALPKKLSFFLSYFDRSKLSKHSPYREGTPEWQLWSDRVWSKQEGKLVVGEPNFAKYSKSNAPLFSSGPPTGSDSSQWVTSLTEIGICGTDFRVPLKSTFKHPKYPDGIPALADTGSSLIILSPDVWDALAEGMTTSRVGCVHETDAQMGKVLSCPCSSGFVGKQWNTLKGVREMPNLRFEFASPSGSRHGACIHPSEFMMKDLLRTHSQCRLAIQRGNAKMPYPVVLGTVFLRSFYSSFDLEQNQVFFARSSLSPLGADYDCPLAVASDQSRFLFSRIMAFLILASPFGFTILSLALLAKHGHHIADKLTCFKRDTAYPDEYVSLLPHTTSAWARKRMAAQKSGDEKNDDDNTPLLSGNKNNNLDLTDPVSPGYGAKQFGFTPQMSRTPSLAERPTPTEMSSDGPLSPRKNVNLNSAGLMSLMPRQQKTVPSPSPSAAAAQGGVDKGKFDVSQTETTAREAEEMILMRVNEERRVRQRASETKMREERLLAEIKKTEAHQREMEREKREAEAELRKRLEEKKRLEKRAAELAKNAETKRSAEKIRVERERATLSRMDTELRKTTLAKMETETRKSTPVVTKMETETRKSTVAKMETETRKISVLEMETETRGKSSTPIVAMGGGPTDLNAKGKFQTILPPKLRKK